MIGTWARRAKHPEVKPTDCGWSINPKYGKNSIAASKRAATDAEIEAKLTKELGDPENVDDLMKECGF